jgi:hypothetical protein
MVTPFELTTARESGFSTTLRVPIGRKAPLDDNDRRHSTFGGVDALQAAML